MRASLRRNGVGPTSWPRLRQNRYYSSILGRFLTPDPSKSANPANPGTWNRYAYVNDDPVNFNDPTGLVGVCPPGTTTDPTGFGCQPQPPACYTAEIAGDGWNNPECYIELESQSHEQQAQAQQGGRGGAPNLQALQNAISEADKLLLTKDCAAFLGAGVADPYLILQGLGVSKNGQYGSISFGQISSAAGTTTFATTSIASSTAVAIGNGATQLQAQTVSITLNTLSGGFLSETLYDQAITLLHELGHTIYDLFGPMGTGQLGSSYPIQPDLNNTKASMANTNAIQNHCH